MSLSVKAVRIARKPSGLSKTFSATGQEHEADPTFIPTASGKITPLTDRDAAQMLREIKGFRLLQGYRGHPAADVEAIEEVLLRLSRLVEEIPEISELDLNPIFALPPGQGCGIVDARIRVESSAS
jgi:acyl-CoA synthetase (NDP forming)